jgi:hypothetical protein
MIRFRDGELVTRYSNQHPVQPYTLLKLYPLLFTATGCNTRDSFLCHSMDMLLRSEKEKTALPEKSDRETRKEIIIFLLVTHWLPGGRCI